MDYSPFITNASRTVTAADRMEVFGAGTDPAGLGTLGAPVNPEHVFDYLGEDLPPFGSPQAVLGPQAVAWERGFEDAYGGKLITIEQDRFSPNTSKITLSDPEPLVMRDEISGIKNNAQIMREKTARSVRYYPARPSADVLATQVNADQELRDLQAQAVALVYESQMDAIRATHAAAKSRGSALRGERLGALPVGYVVPPKAPALKPAQVKALQKWLAAVAKAAQTAKKKQGTKSMPIKPGTVTAAAQAATTGSSSSDVGTPATDDYSEVIVEQTVADNMQLVPPTMGSESSALDTRFDPSKIALILGGVGLAAVVGFFVFRGRK